MSPKRPTQSSITTTTPKNKDMGVITITRQFNSCKWCRMLSYSSSWWIFPIVELINFLWPIWILNQILKLKTLVEVIIPITFHKIYKMLWVAVGTSWWWMNKTTIRMVKVLIIIFPTKFCNRISSQEVLEISCTINSYISNSSNYYLINLCNNSRLQVSLIY